jgi:hypothetical protein
MKGLGVDPAGAYGPCKRVSSSRPVAGPLVAAISVAVLNAVPTASAGPAAAAKAKPAWNSTT